MMRDEAIGNCAVGSLGGTDWKKLKTKVDAERDVLEARWVGFMIENRWIMSRHPPPRLLQAIGNSLSIDEIGVPALRKGDTPEALGEIVAEASDFILAQRNEHARKRRRREVSKQPRENAGVDAVEARGPNRARAPGRRGGRMR